MHRLTWMTFCCVKLQGAAANAAAHVGYASASSGRAWSEGVNAAMSNWKVASPNVVIFATENIANISKTENAAIARGGTNKYRKRRQKQKRCKRNASFEKHRQCAQNRKRCERHCNHLNIYTARANQKNIANKQNPKRCKRNVVGMGTAMCLCLQRFFKLSEQFVNPTPEK